MQRIVGHSEKATGRKRRLQMVAIQFGNRTSSLTGKGAAAPVRHGISPDGRAAALFVYRSLPTPSCPNIHHFDTEKSCAPP
ncbi:MAG: hypothetical protein IJJ45_11045 [Clostridia bacterium]|nr:hypothetical protein [Clostridia bacterium]